MRSIRLAYMFARMRKVRVMRATTLVTSRTKFSCPSPRLLHSLIDEQQRIVPTAQACSIIEVMANAFHQFLQRANAVAAEESKLITQLDTIAAAIEQHETDHIQLVRKHEEEIAELISEREAVNARMSVVKEQQTILMGDHDTTESSTAIRSKSLDLSATTQSNPAALPLPLALDSRSQPDLAAATPDLLTKESAGAGATATTLRQPDAPDGGSSVLLHPATKRRRTENEVKTQKQSSDAFVCEEHISDGEPLECNEGQK